VGSGEDTKEDTGGGEEEGIDEMFFRDPGLETLARRSIPLPPVGVNSHSSLFVFLFSVWPVGGHQRPTGTRLRSCRFEA